MHGQSAPVQGQADEIALIEQDHRFEIRLGGFGLTVTGNFLIGDDAHGWIAADDGTLEVCNLDRPACLRCLRGTCKSTAGPTGEHRCSCYSRERSHKSSSRKVTH